MTSPKRCLVEKLMTRHLRATQKGYFELRPVLHFLDELVVNSNHPKKTIHDYLVGVLLMELFTLAELTHFLQSGMSDIH